MVNIFKMGRDKKNVVRELFEIVDGVSKCKQPGCNSTSKGDHHGNLQRHIMKCHREIFDAVVSEEFESGLTPTPPPKKKIAIEMSQADMITAMIELVANEGAPFKLLDSRALKIFINPICIGLNIPI